jgi:hypothetical protein
MFCRANKLDAKYFICAARLLPLLGIDSPATQVNSLLPGPPDIVQAIEAHPGSTFRCSKPQTLAFKVGNNVGLGILAEKL